MWRGGKGKYKDKVTGVLSSQIKINVNEFWVEVEVEEAEE
jgi:hypothetical protein